MPMTLQELGTVLSLKARRLIAAELGVLVILAIGTTPVTMAQVNCAAGSASSSKLTCLIPLTVTTAAPGFTFSNAPLTAGTTTVSSNLDFLRSDIGGEISQIPLASPASGIIFTTDPTLHVPVPLDLSLGPILTQRAETIGRHKVYISMTYQYFLLEDVDGLSLKRLPATFLLNSPNSNPAAPDSGAFVNSRIDLKVHQWVGYATFGLTNRIDVSVAVPLLRVDMRYTISGTLATPSGISQISNTTQAEEATGIGDVIVAMKGNVWKLEHGGGLALGTEVRLPTGDSANFLGSGTVGVKPFATFTHSGRISPHINIAYQVNGNTSLVSTSAGKNGSLPNRLIYSGGADWRLAKRLTIAADAIAQRVFDAPRARIAQNLAITIGNNTFTNPETTITSKGSYNRTDGSIGLKLKPFGKLLISANLLVKLDQGGLRERMAPLFGASYTF